MIQNDVDEGQKTTCLIPNWKEAEEFGNINNYYYLI